MNYSMRLIGLGRIVQPISTRKKSEKFPIGILPSFPVIAAVFLQNTRTFPRFPCSILQDQSAGMFNVEET